MLRASGTAAPLAQQRGYGGVFMLQGRKGQVPLHLTMQTGRGNSEVHTAKDCNWNDTTQCQCQLMVSWIR